MRGAPEMLLDYVTLLTAVGISAACLSIMVFLAWLMAPRDAFLLTVSLGGAMCGLGLLLYGFYVANLQPIVATSAFSVIYCGLAMLVGAGHQFRTDRLPRWMVARHAIAANVIGLPMLAAGYTGLGFVPINLMVTFLLLAVIVQYWKARRQAPVIITSLCILYGLIAASFLLCALAILRDGRTVLPGAPGNWAEDLSLLVLIAVVPGIGALTLALTQARQVRRHRQDAMTDSLTGLLNRRALFDMFGLRPLPRETAVIVFDIDRFKSINDRHGHAVGDRVIALFAAALEMHLADGGAAARLGGEEFALVVPATTAEGSLHTAEAVRESFQRLVNQLGLDGMGGTASAGIAFGMTHGAAFETVLSAADKALYAAKNAGRDCVMSAEPQIASQTRSKLG
ncbi:GGDEF domain-containing protein [Ancylobacter sp. MQZ15Z-1]|uniref:diguanylate cyclase n=1 Tax=Ancylobacter mangrovi TaxID=2972472 RepID=A0A9X2PB42_9HYPH|nr:GGDEF domain-containing protein [Ancylobacter mangrovi]MCS0493651.1 GGDEF domain-containing protein [Ancylobacter mangrovi]